MAILLTITVIALLLVASEYVWRRRQLHDEFSRKFVHITVGSFVAFWPFFLSWQEIYLLSVAFLAVIAVSKYLNIFRIIHSVQRPTLGEVFFAVAVGAIALVTQDKYIYAVALLHMSVADGMAAIIGTRFGKGQRYYVLGQAKSIIGTATFFVVSLALLVGYSALVAPLALPLIIGVAVTATLIENLGVQGLDNILVPLLVAGLLSLS